MRLVSRSSFALLRLAMAAVVLVSGCAGLPRIDPSGRRIFIWPDADPPAVTAAPAVPGLGNVQAPPLYPGQSQGPLALPTEPTNVNPAVGAAVGAPTFGGAPANTTTAAKPPEEKLSITPSRVLAPIGSEVILKAGVCGDNGYLRTNRRIEWMLGQEGAGQFVRIGEQGEMDVMRLPWQRPNKFDNAYAVGYTTPFNVCLRRGTDDPSDDVQVERGEAWITVSSASEGVSYITATAPETSNWEERRASATVYWIDAQWRFPGTLNLQPGRNGDLVTTVTRQSDGAPIQGWLVRYEVLRGDTARLGYQAGQTFEDETDAQGAARVKISATDNQPGVAQVKVTVIRPAQSAPMASPRLEVGSGEVLVNWSPTAVVAPPISSGPPVTNTPTPPAPFQPPPPAVSDPIAPPLPRRGPEIEVQLRRITPDPIQPNDVVQAEIVLINNGDAPAEDLVLEVDFDTGLTSPQVRPGERGLSRDDIPDLGPGESSPIIPLNVAAVLPGLQRYRVSVTGAGGLQALEVGEVQVLEPEPPPRPQLRIVAEPPAIADEGAQANCVVTVFNDGQAAVEGVRVDVLNSPELTPLTASDGWRELANGLAWENERIEAGGQLQLEVVYSCEAATQQAVVTTYAQVDGEDVDYRTVEFEIRAPARPPAGAPGAAAPLSGQLSSTANPARVGDSALLTAAITNTTNTPLNDVQFRVVFPQQIEPRLTDASVQRNRNALEFRALDNLAAGETHRVSIPYMPLEQGRVAIDLQMRIGPDGAPYQTQLVLPINAR